MFPNGICTVLAIEDVYTEFEYPKEISNLIGYMPCDDSRPMDEKLYERYVF